MEFLLYWFASAQADVDETNVGEGNPVMTNLSMNGLVGGIKRCCAA